MNSIKVFLTKYSITTHSIVAFAVLVTTAYYQVPQFHDYVLQLYGVLPAGLRNFIGVVIAVVAWYWQGRKPWTDAERKDNLTP